MRSQSSVGELLANVVTHTDSGAQVLVDWVDGTPTLTVIDADFTLTDLPPGPRR